MSQSQSIHDALKRLLRARGRTYAQAAKVLQLSEASIKRLFSQNALSLSRLEALCNWLHVDILDVVRASREQEPLTTQLSEAQEAALPQDIGLMLLAHLLLNNWTVSEILATYSFSRPELTRRMYQLERLGLVEVLPFDRVRLKTARNFSWRKEGPVQRFFTDQVLKEFLNCKFEQPGERMEFVSGMLSRKSILHMQERIAELAREMDDLVESDLEFPADDRLGTSLCVAFRPWEFSGFGEFRKAERTKTL